MNFNKHSHLPKDAHAFIGASKYHWINYNPEKLATAYRKHLSVEMGTKKHALAKQLIEMGIKLPRSQKTFNMYVNDAIGFRMTPEQILYYSDNAFGTADAISFRDNLLRIHDLKTGETPASMHQLEVYASFFCLEYNIKPGDIDMELRLYQKDQIIVANPTAEIILPIMDKIIAFDKIIETIKMEG